MSKDKRPAPDDEHKIYALIALSMGLLTNENQLIAAGLLPTPKYKTVFVGHQPNRVCTVKDNRLWIVLSNGELEFVPDIDNFEAQIADSELDLYVRWGR